MQDKHGYILLSTEGTTQENFTKAVNYFLLNGWKLIGTPFSHDDELFQALIKPACFEEGGCNSSDDDLDEDEDEDEDEDYADKVKDIKNKIMSGFDDLQKLLKD